MAVVPRTNANKRESKDHYKKFVTSKGVELSCELDCAISFWTWILSRKYPHFEEISIFRGYYPHFVEISTFCEYYPHFVDISVFRGYYPHFVEISTFCRYYPYFMEISTSCRYYPHFVDTIRISHITSYLAHNDRHVLHSFALVVDIILVTLQAT